MDCRVEPGNDSFAKQSRLPNSNWRFAVSLCINRPFAVTDPALPMLRRVLLVRRNISEGG
jgi:hypothetical protein